MGLSWSTSRATKDDGSAQDVDGVEMGLAGEQRASGDDGSNVWTKKKSRHFMETLHQGQLPVTSTCISSDGKRLFYGSEKTVKVWNFDTGECERVLEGHNDDVTSVAVSPDGKRLFSGSGDKTVKAWDIETGDLIRTFEGHTETVTSVAVSPDGKRLFSGSYDKTVKAWDIETGDLIRTFEGHTDYVKSVAVSPDGKRLFSGSDDTTVKAWDVETGDLVRTFEGHTDEVTSVAVSPDGKRLFSGCDDKTVKAWDVETGDLIRTFEGHTSTASSVAVSPDGKSLFSGSADKSIMQCDVTHLGHQALPARVWEQYDLDSADKKSRTGTGAFLWPRVHSLLQDKAHAGLLMEGNTAKPNHRSVMHQAAVDGHDDFLKQLLPQCPASAVAMDQKGHSCLWHAVNANSEKAAEAICEFWASSLLKQKEHVARVDPARQKEPHLGDLVDISELQALGKKYPKIFRGFVRLVEPVAAYAFVPGNTATSEFNEDSESPHFLQPTDLRSPPEMWDGDDNQAPKGTAPASSCLLPIANLLEPPFLRACILCCEKLNEATVFESPLCRYVVQQKWDEFGRFVYNVEMAVYFALMVVNALLVIALKGGREETALAAGALSAALAMSFLFREFAQFYCGVRLAAAKGGSESAVQDESKNQQQRGLLSRFQEGFRHLTTHFGDVWNWLVLVAHVSVFAGSLMAILHPGSPTTRVLVGSSQLPLYLNFLWYGRARKGIGQLIRMVFVIVVDIQFLLYIIALVIVAFALCFYLILNVPSGRDELTPDWVDGDYDGYRNLFLSMVTTFRGALGDFDFADLEQSDSLIMSHVLAATLLLLVTVLFLNLLIAIMGDSYEKVKEVENGEFTNERAQITVEYEHMLTTFPGLAKLFNIAISHRKWLQVLRPGAFSEEDRHSEWTGVSGKIGELERAIEGCQKGLEQKMEQNLKDLDQKMEHLDQKMGQILELLEVGASKQKTE